MKPYAIEARIKSIRNDKTDSGLWFSWNKYKSIKSMLQGLSDLRKNNNISYWQTPSNGEIAIWKFTWQYRPVHSRLI